MPLIPIKPNKLTQAEQDSFLLSKELKQKLGFENEISSSKSWKLYFSHGIILNKIIPKEKFLSSSTKKIKPELPSET